MSNERDELTTLLNNIEAALLTTVPAAVGQMHAPGPVYAVLLVYDNGTSAEGFALNLTVCPAASRATLAAGDARAWSLPELGPVPTAPLTSGDLAEQVNACYEALLDSEESEDLEDDEAILPFRESLYRVAQQLNQRDWSKTLDVTPDFAVLATDRSGLYLGDDAPASLPQDRLSDLRSTHHFPF